MLTDLDKISAMSLTDCNFSLYSAGIWTHDHQYMSLLP